MPIPLESVDGLIVIVNRLTDRLPRTTAHAVLSVRTSSLSLQDYTDDHVIHAPKMHGNNALNNEFWLKPATDQTTEPRPLSKHLDQLAHCPDTLELVQHDPKRLRRLYLEFNSQDLKQIRSYLAQAGLNPNTLQLLDFSDESLNRPTTCLVSGPTNTIIAFLHQAQHTNEAQLLKARIDFPEFTWLSPHIPGFRHR